ncbi:rhomboid family intramembrane serine protease (plasmid) [Rhizobium sp. CB3171]|uniref:rhomboid family intramembrane serine protease n=1 Tax=unclassified Rhizobium TaxID=2613769 RepID=UPI0021A6449B|nr:MULTISPECIES: rhomboid family intramembrane serine protease [Rhizobium]UWU24300.1 rhomboid family intramembrane serine protease [Rhizobium tropici]WFU05283.1 rhomboid family intramembrane serine protease [Rhizobium sp. CB3171]
MHNQDTISLESFSADPQVRRKMEFAYDKGRLLWLVFLAQVIAVAVAGGPLLPDRPGHPHLSAIFCWPLAALISLLGLVLLVKAARGKPGLIASPDGIYIETHADETIPWRSVRDIRRYQRKRADQLYVDLDPIAARTLTRRGLMRWLPRALQGRATPAVVSLKLLRADPDWVYAQCLEFLAKNREQQALTDGGVTSPPEDHAAPVFDLKGRPFFTYALIAVLVGIYVAELKFGVVPEKQYAPSTQTLLVLGGTFRQRILQYGEWWRLVTASLLHGNILHLAFNCFALWRAGILLERLIGWRWFAALFCLSAVGGSTASLLMNPANMVGVGASGGIIGLFAAVIVASFHFPAGPLPEILRMGAVQILVPSILPLVGQTADGMHIDYAAHLGGALAGGIVSLGLLKAWPNNRPHPRFGVVALISSVAFATIALGSIWPVSQLRAGYLGDPFVQYFQGQYQRAADDFVARIKLNPDATPYYHLWRFLAQTRGNDSQAASDLRMAAGKLDQSKWPYPVYKLFLGEFTPEEVTAKATNNDSLCEATFYVGEWHLLRGESAEAIPKFNAALLSCPKTFMEYEGAQGELLQLSRH